MGFFDNVKKDANGKIITNTTGAPPPNKTNPKENNNTKNKKVQNINPSDHKMLNLSKEAKIILEKNNYSDLKANVYLVLDYSGSMSRYYKDGTVQEFTEKIIAIAANLDDDGILPTILFDDHPREIEEISTKNYHGAIEKIRAKSGHMGTTDYTRAMETVIHHYKKSESKEAALVIFQTDGAPNNKRATEKLLCESASLPIFWQFVGFGRETNSLSKEKDPFEFLKKLDDLAVPKYRLIDNADFFSAGENPKNISNKELYEKLLTEFPSWHKQAIAQGILQK